MSEHRHYSGPDLASLLRQVDDELGSDAVIVKADRVRSGGMAGFFAREHYEVVASRPDISTPVPPLRTPSRHSGASDLDDEMISTKPIAPPPLPSLPVPRAPLPAPVTQPPGHVPQPPARSIQSALLDRADQVSTEELLARAAELDAPEWGNGSFRSILGQAVAHSPDPQPTTGPGKNVRSHTSPVGPDSQAATEPIIGLRHEPVRPDETVIDPLPNVAPPTVPEPTEQHLPAPPRPPTTNHDVPPRPYPVPVPVPAIESAVLVNSTPNGRQPVHQPTSGAAAWPSASAPVPAVDWSEVQREIDGAVRSRIDAIVQALRQPVAGQPCECGRALTNGSAVNDREPGQDRLPSPPPPPPRPASRRVGPDRRRTVAPVSRPGIEG